MTISVEQEQIILLPSPGYVRGSSNAAAIARRYCRLVNAEFRQNVTTTATIAFPTGHKARLIICTLGSYTATIPDETSTGKELFFYVGYGTSGTITIADGGGTITTLTAVGQYCRIYDDQGTWKVIDPLPDDGEILIPVEQWREVSSGHDVGDIAANGGILASDTTPILRAGTNEDYEISWAAGDVDQIAVSLVLPRDFDDTADATLELWVSSGTTDAATLAVDSTWAAGGASGSVVADSASDAATKSATPHKITATIATADIPAGATRVTISLLPPTHGTNAIQLHGSRLIYSRKANVD